MTLDASSSPLMTEVERDMHIKFMQEAMTMARYALESSETPVGCVLVYENQIISCGMNDTNRSLNGTRHAEFVALDNYISRKVSCTSNLEFVRDNEQRQNYYPIVNQNQKTSCISDILANCTLYVTVEPCIMCASLLRQIGIKRVFFGAWNDRFGGTGSVIGVHKADELNTNTDGKKEGYEVSGGWLREEAILLLRRFYVQENERAPEPRDKSKRVLKMVVDPIHDMNIIDDNE